MADRGALVNDDAAGDAFLEPRDELCWVSPRGLDDWALGLNDGVAKALGIREFAQDGEVDTPWPLYRRTRFVC